MNEMDIDKLLNGYLDDELSVRQQTEVKRLIGHDQQVAIRLRELQKIKMLVSSLPRIDAPHGLKDDVKISLERRALLKLQPKTHQLQRGSRDLMARKLIAAAAMIILVGILAVVVYSILAPQTQPHTTVAFNDLPVKAESEMSLTPVADTERTDEASLAINDMAFRATLQLKTEDTLAMKTLVEKTLVVNQLEFTTSSDSIGNKLFAVACNKAGLSLLIADLEKAWKQLDDSTLFVKDQKNSSEVVVANVNPEQIMEIANQDEPETSLQAAQVFATLNDMAELLPGEELLINVDDKQPDLVTIPKPVLASGEKRLRKPGMENHDNQVYLTIAVIPNQ